MQVTYRIPSKKVPYGYVEIVDDAPINGMPDPTDLAQWYAQYIREYQAAEVAAFEGPPVKPEVIASASANEAAQKAHDEVLKMLNDGLGGVEEIEENAPVKPWDKASEATATEEKKPWVASDGDWDFS